MKSDTEIIGYSIIFENFSFAPTARAPRKVLDDISLTISSGEFITVVGENGSGKSSLLAAISGELNAKQGETSGVVRIGQYNIDRPIQELVNRVGIVHQHEELDLVEHLTVAQNIALRNYLQTRKHKGFWLVNDHQAREYRTELLSHLPGGDTIQLDQSVSRLAGGQKQLLAVLIATWFEHKKNPCLLLLLDEHTSRLSSQNAKKVMDVTTSPRLKAHGCTTVMVTHDLEDALNYGDSIIIMNNGKASKYKSNTLTLPKLKELVFP